MHKKVGISSLFFWKYALLCKKDKGILRTLCRKIIGQNAYKNGGNNMISNQILQSTIDGIKAITRADLCVMDTDGKVHASTGTNIGDYENAVRVFAESPAESQVVQGCQFFKIYDDYHLEYILLVYGAGEELYTIGKMAAFQLQGLLVAYKERFDKDNFIKNLLLDNLLLVDIYNRAKKLHIDTEARRVIFIIEMPEDKTVLFHIRESSMGMSRKNKIDVICYIDPHKYYEWICAGQEYVFPYFPK